jgi:hypothetical protein
MPQYFCPFDTKEKHTLLAKGEETTTSQAQGSHPTPYKDI